MSIALEELREALGLMESALALMDKANQALDVAAHLDLAIQRLREQLEPQPWANS